MPRGRYSFHDTHDHTPLGSEHFHCATGPSGWRYTAQATAPDGDHSGSVDSPSTNSAVPSSGTARRRLAGPCSRTRRCHLGPYRSTGEFAQEGNAPPHAFSGASPRS